LKSWIKEHSKGSTLSLYVQPGATKTSISGEHDGRLKIRIKAPPVDGEANKCLIEFLSETFKISKAKIHLLSGESSRQKLVLVELSVQELMSFFSSE
jgi:uncharacterized protein (TIGR00251 family)